MTIAEETPKNTTPESYLIAEFGSINTTAVLFDTAAGSYRLLARGTSPTTAIDPWSNIAEGLVQAIRQIEGVTGRTLLNEHQQLITPERHTGIGVDKFAVLTSAATPLNTLLVGLFDEVSLESARHVLHTTYATEVDCISLNDPRDEGEKFSAIVNKRPEVVLIVGGTDGGAEQRLLHLIDTLQLGINVLSENQRTFVLYAGNKALREAVNNRLKEIAHVQVAENVRPNLELEYLDDAAKMLNSLYEDVKITKLPGFQAVQSWAGKPAMSTAYAFTLITKYFASLQNHAILGIDIGSNSVTIIAADPHAVKVHVRTDLGMGKPLINFLDHTTPADIARWIPHEVTDDQVRDFLVYKSLYPQTIPQTEFELYLEQAVAREVIRAAMPPDLPAYAMILARGAVLTNTPRPGQTVLMLLDALQPSGIFSIALDKYNVLPALGALAMTQPTAVVQALEAGVLTDLGWVIVPTGKGQSGQSVITGIVESEQLGQFNLDIEYGSIDTTVLASGQIANVTLNPNKRNDIGFGIGKGKKITVRGGAVGLVIDGRGRPLMLPNGEDKFEIVRKWHWDVGG
ncbi:MAG: glutamate mutase L [Anaerolineae bacterium]|nr:glutamate mutase L [Anaerolineae bacterium]